MFRKPIVLGLSVVTAFASIGVAYACYNPPPPPAPICTCNTGFSWVVSNDDGSTTKISNKIIDTGDTGSGTQYDAWGNKSSNDPTAPQTPFCAVDRQVKDVGKTTACIPSSNCGCDNSSINVNIYNAYPYYYPTVFFGLDNNQCYDVTIKSITITGFDTTKLSVSVCGITVGQVISSCQEVIGSLQIELLQPAAQNSSYSFTVTICLQQNQKEQAGNCNFWKNWNCSGYSKNQCQGWLGNLSNCSKWLGPTNCTDMVTWEGKYTNGTAKDQFLACYLALRMDVSCGRKSMSNWYDCSGADPGHYLGLTGYCTLQQICNAIEGKYSSSLSSSQYHIMQTVCDYIDNIGN